MREWLEMWKVECGLQGWLEIPNYKSQIPKKSQIPNYKLQRGGAGRRFTGFEVEWGVAALRLVIQPRGEPFFGFGEGLVFALGVVLDLVASEFSDAEIF